MKFLHKITALTLVLAMLLSGSCLRVFAMEGTEPAITAEAMETEALTEPGEAAEETTVLEETQPQEAPVPEETKEAQAPAQTPEADSEVDMPACFQDDYPDTPYGGGTIATHGSGITALAMVASYLKEESYTPDRLAEDLGDGSDVELMERSAKKLGLSWYRSSDPQEVFQALKKGNVIICNMNDQSVFTSSTHRIVLKQITEDGKIRVADPLRSNREKSMLQEGYTNGFPQGWISTGMDGAWIFDPEYVAEEAPAEPEEDFQGQMPLFNQMDYKDVRYGAGTVATSGCGITALAMVATYMTGHTYYPDELADYFGGYNGNNIERLLNASDELKLPWHAVENWHMALQALKEGKIAIIMVNGRSLFTENQHFLVATGVTKGGKVWINDPYGPNYSVPVLKQGFENGFAPEWIATGYSAAWVYDVDAMPEDPFIYVKEETHVEPRYGDLALSDADTDLLARLVWVEARGEDYDGQQAVAEVILNRLYSDQFPNTMRAVIFAENQFRGSAFVDEAEPTQTQYEAVERALYGPYVLPMDVTHFATYAVNKNVWGTIGGHTFCYQWSPDR